MKRFQIEEWTHTGWEMTGETTIAELLAANPTDGVVNDIAAALCELAVGQDYVYEGGAGGDTRWTRLEDR